MLKSLEGKRYSRFHVARALGPGRGARARPQAITTARRNATSANADVVLAAGRMQEPSWCKRTGHCFCLALRYSVVALLALQGVSVTGVSVAGGTCCGRYVLRAVRVAGGTCCGRFWNLTPIRIRQAITQESGAKLTPQTRLASCCGKSVPLVKRKTRP